MKLFTLAFAIALLAAVPAGAAAKKKSAPKPTPAPVASPYIPTAADMARYADNVCKQRGYDAYARRANNSTWSRDYSAHDASQRVERECRQYLITHTRTAMPPLEGELQSFATSIPRLQTITSTRAPASTPDQGTMTPEALTYYCAGQAGMQMSQSISTSQMLRFSACFEQNKHRIR